jgi:hypothetical protein
MSFSELIGTSFSYENNSNSLHHCYVSLQVWKNLCVRSTKKDKVGLPFSALE